MKPYFTRKESIIITAIEIIDDLGFNDLSLREIGNRQGISDSAIYKHFRSKEEIILAVLDYYSRFDERIMSTINESNFAPKEAILFYIKSMVEVYESQPSITSVPRYFELQKIDSPAVKKAKDIFSERSKFVQKLILKGQFDGSITDKVQSEDLADAILGLKRVILLKWSMESYSFPLKNRVEKATTSILERF